MNEHGYCPYCNADLDGEDIVQTFIEMGNSPEDSAKIAADCYGYRKGKTKWGRDKMITDWFGNKIGYQCPDCGETWGGNTVRKKSIRD